MFNQNTCRSAFSFIPIPISTFSSDSNRDFDKGLDLHVRESIGFEIYLI